MRCKLVLLFFSFFFLGSVSFSQDVPSKKASLDKGLHKKAPLAPSQKALPLQSKKHSSQQKRSKKPSTKRQLATKLSAISHSEEIFVIIYQILHSYQSEPSVTMNVRKTVYSSILEDLKKSEGHLKLSKGKLRVQINKPDKSLIVMDGDSLWLASYPPKDLGGDVQVSKISMDKVKHQEKSLLSLLFGNTNYLNKFRLVEPPLSQTKRQYTLLPHDLKNEGEIKKIQIELDADNKKIIGIKYWDQLDNWTDYQFSHIRFPKKANPKDFVYTPPKGVDVTEF